MKQFFVLTIFLFLVLLTGAVVVYLSNPDQIKSLPTSRAFVSLPIQEKQQFIEELTHKDPALTWQYLRKLTKETKRGIDGHDLAHVMGNELYKTHGLNGIIHCELDFGFGCYHGVSEEMLLENGKDSIADIEAKCTDFYENTTTNIKGNGCIHGLGHGLALWNSLNLSQSLADCDSLRSENRSACYNGVFMEYTGSVAVSPLPEPDPWTFCTDLAPSYQEMCSSYFYKLLTRKAGSFNFTNIAKVCMQAPHDNLQETCITNLTFDVTHRERGNVDKIIAQCRTIKEEEGQLFCVMSTARALKSQNYGNQDDWEAVCRQHAPSDKEQCIRSLDGI